MTIAFKWRGEFTSAEANALHAECFGHPVLGDDEWDWRGQVEGHSLSWVCACDRAELIGFVDVAWDGVVHAFVLDTMVAAGLLLRRLRVHPDQRRPDRAVERLWEGRWHGSWSCGGTPTTTATR
jgi:hypothetical protein